MAVGPGGARLRNVPRRLPRPPGFSHTMYFFISFRKPTPHNRQLNILISSSKQQIDDFLGGVTF